MGAPEFRIDLHVHSSWSRRKLPDGPLREIPCGSQDSEADPEACIERAIELGLHGIAFTEHYYYGASEPVESLKARFRGRILILRGVEFSTAEGHCLVFGADTDRLLTPRAPAEELVREVNRAGGVAIPSHPYRGSDTSLGELAFSLPGFVAVEGHNGVNSPGFNDRALKAARRRGLPVTGGSDAHFANDVGACCTIFRERVTAENFVDLLRAGRFDAEDRRPKYSWGLPRG